MAFGLLPTGFAPKTSADVLQDMRADAAATFSASFDTTDGSAAGTLFIITSSAIGEVWEVTEQLASSTDRDSATGPRLDAIGAVTGTLRNAAENSTVTVTLTGVPLTVITTPFRVATASTGAAFAASENTVLVALDVWAALTVYAIGARVTNDGGRAYICTTAGTSAASGGPTGESTAITDGSVVWAWLGAGTGAVDAVLTAVDSGVVVAAARDLTVIQNPTVGLQNVTNLEDAVAGVFEESDPAYRIRQVEELADAGSHTAAAIRGALLKLPGVVAAHVFMNLTDTVDGDGVPAHGIEALVQGGDDQAIGDLLGVEVVTGIVTTGNTSVTTTDEEGTSFVVNFSRPAQILVYIRETLTKASVGYGGDNAAKAAIVAYGDEEQIIGKDLVPSSVGASVLPVKVSGVQVAGVTGVIKNVRTDAFTDVIAAPVAWAALTAYVATLGARSVVTNDGGRAYICTTAGTSAASGGPTGESTAITDGSVVWAWLGADIPVSQRQIALLDVSRVTISSSTATP